jgi:hypothetical protein
MSLINAKEESILLSHIVDGLSAAIKAEDVSLGANGSSDFRQVRDIRTNKLVLEAVDEVDVPIFWSWFRYGRCLTNRAALGKKVNWESLDSDEEAEAATDIHQNAKSKAWYRDYFINDVEISGKIGVAEICEMDVDEFLKGAYKDAPEQHSDLYMANLEVQEILREVAFDDSWHEQSPDGQFYQDVWDATRRLQDKLILHPEMPAEDTQLVSEYLRLVRQAVAEVCATDEILEPHETLSSLVRKYHDPVWRLPALRISSLTGNGRNHSSKQQKYREEANTTQRKEVTDSLTQIRHNLQGDYLSRSSKNLTFSNGELRNRTKATEDALLQ